MKDEVEAYVESFESLMDAESELVEELKNAYANDVIGDGSEWSGALNNHKTRVQKIENELKPLGIDKHLLSVMLIRLEICYRGGPECD